MPWSAVTRGYRWQHRDNYHLVGWSHINNRRLAGLTATVGHDRRTRHPLDRVLARLVGAIPSAGRHAGQARCPIRHQGADACERGITQRRRTTGNGKSTAQNFTQQRGTDTK
jgi:hypothetical protein